MCIGVLFGRHWSGAGWRLFTEGLVARVSFKYPGQELGTMTSCNAWMLHTVGGRNPAPPKKP